MPYKYTITKVANGFIVGVMEPGSGPQSYTQHVAVDMFGVIDILNSKEKEQ